ncbi:ABC transporter permease [Paenibacillus sp. MMS20-IR301]|uniref:ABC transporter permease n=1 Tax=Paenibacillus sp. MMS20-IR301 TaxID=2895946 RepID=UPI0028EFFBC9|nr:ABC transporter permease [Paenibacillus sp. MMS20-IR301]WNS41836.1 ABC transporter permease [Paenibacillus sp. MMS20-IR301]
MRIFLGILSAERLKISKSWIWLLVLLSPAISVPIGLITDLKENGTLSWQVLMNAMTVIHALLFLPVLSGIFAALICRSEHSDGGWKLLLALPVRRTWVYMAKYLMIMLLLAVVQLSLLAAVLGVGLYRGAEGAVPWSLLLPGLFGGWFACLPLAALQLAVSQGWSSFGAPLALNVSFTIPNMLIVNSSRFGPYYPWVQPMLAMSPYGEENFGAFNLPLESLMIVVAGSLIVFLAGGLFFFWRKAV